MLAASKAHPIVLSLSEKDRRVLVEWPEGDRFVTSVESAARACHQAVDQYQFGKQFEKLLDRLGRWLQVNRKKAARGFLTVQDAGLLFVVIQKTESFDRRLQDRLIDLDIEVARKPEFDLISLDVQPLPATSEDAFSSFLHPQHTWEYQYAD